MRRQAWIFVPLLLSGLALSPAPAIAAEFGIAPGTLSLRTVDSDGLPDNRAGAHPDRLLVDVNLLTEGTGTGARELVFDLPPGFGGDAAAVPACPRIEYEWVQSCPADTQVGVLSQTLEAGGEVKEGEIFNLEPAPDQLAEFSTIGIANIPFYTSLRPSDYGLTLRTEAAQVPVFETHVELWGVPADHLAKEGVSTPRVPFLTTPTRCGSQALVFRTRSWQPNSPWLSATANTPSFTGCKDLPFEPHLGFALTTPLADAPTGMQANLTFPKRSDPDGLVDSQLEGVSIQMPEGMTVSPAGAVGLSACSDAQFGLGEERKSACPFLSKVGSAVIESPQLREPLTGKVYLAGERPGERFRLFVAATAAGTEIKLAGTMRVDPQSGQLTANLNGLPQFPVTRFALSLDGGPRALLATPLNCGLGAAKANFVPYGGGSPVDSSAPVTIGSHVAGSACSGAPFAPELVAGSTNPRAGRATSFSMTLYRRDGEQLPDRFEVQLPPGLSPALGTVQRCESADVTAATCPAASRVGSAVAEVGSGPNPAAIEGDAYLTGPYRHAPFGLALVFHATIGPFDLGSLVIRGKVSVDSLSGRTTIETDPLPAALEGIPLRFQTLGLDLNRPGFLHNPTSCEPTSISATIRANSGASSTSNSPFRLKGCDRLRFQPSFGISLAGGRSQLRRGGKPDLRLSTRLPKGNANLRTLKVSLPPQLRFDVSSLAEICARDDAMRGRCSPRSRVGTSFVSTPLLEKGLKGGVYVVQPKGNGSPDLWSNVNGLGVHLNFRAEISAKEGRAAVELADLPDMPLSRFAMRLDGGEDGVLTLKRGLCAGGRLRQNAPPIVAEGQNGAYRRVQVPLTAQGGCGSSGRSRPAPGSAPRQASR